MADHLEPLGVRTALCGKSHMLPDIAGMKRLGIDPASPQGRRLAEGGFEVWDRLDGIHPDECPPPSHYNDHLRASGFDGANPWEDWANSAEDEDGRLLSGWLMENADKPARAPDEQSETPYTTTRAMEFIEDAGDQSWCLHLSYIKPHWPYIVPEPYHDMYGPDDVQPVKRRESEHENPHPILQAYFEHRFSLVFTRDEVRTRVIPAYMGLIAQIDDQIGRLMAWLDAKDLTKDTLIVFTSDHGDYLGDHWLGEKELFHDASARVPLIVVDPSGEADATRGEVNTKLVEAIDLLPTFVEWFGGEPRPEILEGRSVLPLLHGQDVPWRDVVISEYDYSGRRARKILGQPVSDCRLTMLFDGRWKFIHAEGFRPMLYDLENDPDEYFDLGQETTCADIVHRSNERMGRWNRQHHNRTTISDKAIETRKGGELAKGIILGFWDEDELAEARKDGESGN